MAGPQTPIIKGNKAYGDQKALDSLQRAGTGLKQGNADILPTERRGVGRPAGTSTGQVPQTTQPGVPGIPAEHVQLMEDFARATAVAQIGKAAASDPLAGPWLRAYAQRADTELAVKAERMRAQTPFFLE